MNGTVRRRTGMRFHLATFGLLPGGLLGPLLAHAAPPVDSVPEPVGVEVLCVLATHRPVPPVAALEPLQKKLAFTRYTGFELLGSSTTTLDRGESEDLSCAAGREVTVELVDADDAGATVHVWLTDSHGHRAVDTKVTVAYDRTFMVAGPRVGDDVLVVPITVR
jgi:hypothetical protein